MPACLVVQQFFPEQAAAPAFADSLGAALHAIYFQAKLEFFVEWEGASKTSSPPTPLHP